MFVKTRVFNGDNRFFHIIGNRGKGNIGSVLSKEFTNDDVVGGKHLGLGLLGVFIIGNVHAVGFIKHKGTDNTGNDSQNHQNQNDLPCFGAFFCLFGKSGFSLLIFFLFQSESFWLIILIFHICFFL